MQTANIQTTDFIESLLPPLLARVQAYKQMPNMALKDKAAELLIEQLELKHSSSFSEGESVNSHRAALARCVWTDHCVLEFLKQYPQAVGINLSCGLNTRFHRLSQQLDWPRFRWADIDTQETIAFNQGLLPNIDNYRAIGCDYWQEDWLSRTGWKPGTPVIIVMENLMFTASEDKLQKLFNYIQQIFSMDKNACVHILLDYAPTKPNSPLSRISQWIGMEVNEQNCNALITFDSTKDFFQTFNIRATTIGAQNLNQLEKNIGQSRGKWFSKKTSTHQKTALHISLHPKP